MILDELVALSAGIVTTRGRRYGRDSARAGAAARKRREPVLVYGEAVIAALRACWATLDGATGSGWRRLAGAGRRVRRHGELDVDDATAALLCTMRRRPSTGVSPTTVPAGAEEQLPDRAGSLLKSRSRSGPGPTGMRTARVRRDRPRRPRGRGQQRRLRCSLTVTDIATGWTRSARCGTRPPGTCSAPVEIQAALPFPLLGIDTDNGSESINGHLLAGAPTNRSP